MNNLRKCPVEAMRLIYVTKQNLLRISRGSWIHTAKATINFNNGESFAKRNVFPISYPGLEDPGYPKWGKERRALLALSAGLLGIGGTSLLLCKSSNEVNIKPFFQTAYCAGMDDCEEQECNTDCLRQGEEEEEKIQNANAELERVLLETKGKAIESAETALKAHCDAIEALKTFINKVTCAAEEDNLDSPRFEEVWCDVNNAFAPICDLTKGATKSGKIAWELLCRLRKVIEKGKACKLTSCNPLLATSEETLKCAETELCSKRKTFDALMEEARHSEMYRGIVENYRKDLKAEVDSLVTSDLCRVTLNNNEADMVLTHAYRKILQVQKKLTETGKSNNSDC